MKQTFEEALNFTSLTTDELQSRIGQMQRRIGFLRRNGAAQTIVMAQAILDDMMIEMQSRMAEESFNMIEANRPDSIIIGEGEQEGIKKF